MKLNKINVLGLTVHKIDTQAACSYIDYLLNNGDKHSYVMAQNAEKIMMCLQNKQMRSIMENANLIIPDGVGVSLATKILYRYPTDRVPGFDLFIEVLKLAQKKKYTIYLLGGREEIEKNAISILRKMYRDLRIAGYHNGYFDDDKPIIDEINSFKPDMVFVALGLPKQEKWIYANRNKLNVKLLMGVGGSFDVIAGTAKLAPAFWRNNGFEFVYRLLVDPKRFRRQIVFPKFLLLILLTRVKLRSVL